jgi:hypothetical protein
VTEFRDIIDHDDLSPEEEARLQRVHDLLVQVGPPPDLPPSLEQPPGRREAEIIQFPHLPRRRWAVAAVAAAALALIAFGGGYVLGHSKTKAAGFPTQHVVAMHGPNANAVLYLGNRDGAGNWPMRVEVTGLPTQQAAAYYELWLTRNGKPSVPCGDFRVHGKTTTVRFTVPWSVAGVDGWVVTTQTHGDRTPGPVVLTT